MVEREMLDTLKKSGQDVKGFDALFGNGAGSAA
jgi:hypothetical protein